MKTADQKKEKIKEFTTEILAELFIIMHKQVEDVINSGVIDVEEWDENYAPMVVPKTIVTALLEQNSTQYDARGTSYHKEVKKLVRIIRHKVL